MLATAIGANGTKREMAEDGFMGKHHTGYRGVETRSYRAGNTTTDENICSQEPSGDLAQCAIVAPKWTNGPYCPTDAPPPAEIRAARVEPKPALMSSSLSVRCAA